MFAIALLALSGIANALTMHTPASLVQCQPIKLAWEAGTAPFYLAVVPGGQVASTPIVSWPAMDATSQTWLVNLAAGTSVTIMVTDSTGETSVTSPVSVMAGGNTDCMNATPSASDSATVSPSAPVDTPAVSTPIVSSSASSPAASAPGPASSASAPASSAPVSSAKPVVASSAATSASRAPSSAAASPSVTAQSGAGRMAVSGAAAVVGLVALAAF